MRADVDAVRADAVLGVDDDGERAKKSGACAMEMTSSEPGPGLVLLPAGPVLPSAGVEGVSAGVTTKLRACSSRIVCEPTSAISRHIAKRPLKFCAGFGCHLKKYW